MGTVVHVAVLWANGRPGPACAAKTPFHAACKIVHGIIMETPALDVRDGQIKLSLMGPGTTVRPHAGPTNARMRMHCPIHVSPTNQDQVGEISEISEIKVGTERKAWDPDACFVFREECQHEVVISKSAQSNRVVLIVDFANPFLKNLSLYRNAISTAQSSCSQKQACVDDAVSKEYHLINGFDLVRG